MTAEQYERISRPFRKEKRAKLIKRINKGITLAGYAAYPAILICIFLESPQNLHAAIMVPALGFVLLTFVRRKINRPRPYEALDIVPLIYKDTKGKSMPSRHVFSMTIIAVTGFLASGYLGALLMVFSVLLAVIRVIGGIHYPSDVIAGALTAIAWGTVCYMIIL